MRRIVVDANEAKALAILLSDNGQHRAVDPLKEAATVGALVESLAEQEHPYDRAAMLVGRSPSWVRDRLRLRNLSAAWREAFAEVASPIHQWPVAHFEVIAALPEAVQDQLLADNESAFQEGVPLAIDLWRLVAEYTRDLTAVPWDVGSEGVVPGAPACNACPRRDVCEGFPVREVTDTKKPRCLDAVCFQSKLEATILQPRPGISPSAVDARVGIAEVVCALCGTDWPATSLKPAADAIKTPKAWMSKRAS